MICPSCGIPSSASDSGCEYCGFHVDALRRLLGANQVRLERLTNQAQALRLSDAQLLERRIDDFEHRFPQITVSVFLGELPHGIDPASAAVWLLNQGIMIRHDAVQSNRHSIVLIVNPRAAQAGIAVGYGLEHVLPRVFLRSLLAGVCPLLWHREFGKALRHALDGMDSRLRKLGKAQPRHGRVSGPVGSHLGLATLGPPASKAAQLPQSKPGGVP